MESILIPLSRVEQTCNVCGPSSSLELIRIGDNGYQQCLNCGLIYSTWIATDYEAENEQAFEAELANYAAKASNPKRTRKLKTELKKFEPYRKNHRFLELGCNTGAVLITAREMGWQPFGVDISAAATSYGREHFELSLHTGTIMSANYPDNHFDVVYSNAVLEHVEHPLQTLKEVRRVLRPGGVFYCNTVNWASYTQEVLGEHWFLIDPTHHIHLFTPENVKMLCEKSGLKHLKTWTTGARVEANTPGSTFRTSPLLRLMKGPFSALSRFTLKGDSIHFMATK